MNPIGDIGGGVELSDIKIEHADTPAKMLGNAASPTKKKEAESVSDVYGRPLTMC